MAVVLIMLGSLAFSEERNQDPPGVSEWNLIADQIVIKGGYGPAPAYWAMAIVQTSVYEAVNSISGNDSEPDASVEAAIAAANHTALSALVPAMEEMIESLYQKVLAKIGSGPDKNAGIKAGQKAAEEILAERADLGEAAEEAYRPYTSPGNYVPTTIPAGPQWFKRDLWLMDDPDQFRPDGPPELSSEEWASNLNEVKAYGGKNSDQRNSEQTEIARFWEKTHPFIYHGLVRSFTGQSGRNVLQDARLFAAATQAMDDALTAIMDAKYEYHFWRPITAIRNADQDGNEATDRDPEWTSLIEAPMHPEYPCAHCVLAGALGTVLEAEIGTDDVTLKTSSKTADGEDRSYETVQEFMEEVEQARIYGGVHYRISNETGTEMGIEVGELAVLKILKESE
ncbi:MAG: vanadium-dependent haloperoxidase [Balneolaceae bacterium]|nr:vanadium-dependent haloperoxidase [Balneolaceae bacterium]